MEKVLQSGIRNIIFLTVFFITFVSCYNPTDDISAFSGISMRGRITLIEKKRIDSGGINGDYSCIYQYQIDDPIVITNAECNLKKYSYSDIDTCDILYGYLMYSSGFYKISFVDNSLKSLYIDTTNKKIIYCICSI